MAVRWAPGNATSGSGTGSTRISGNYNVAEAESTLQLEIGGVGMGTDYDFVDVTGDATFDGLLHLELVNGFAPSPNDTFLVFSANDIAGFFDNVGNGGRLMTADGGGSFKVNYGVGSPFDESRIVLSDFVASGGGLRGDFNSDGALTAIDIDLLNKAFVPIRRGVCQAATPLRLRSIPSCWRLMQPPHLTGAEPTSRIFHHCHERLCMAVLPSSQL